MRVPGYVDATPRLPPQVVILSAEGRRVDYRVQGHFSSAGLAARRIAASWQEQASDGGHLTVRHYLRLEAVAGKEGAQVRGYNYQRPFHLTLPDGITRISIELHEQSPAHRRQAGTPTRERLLASTSQRL